MTRAQRDATKTPEQIAVRELRSLVGMVESCIDDDSDDANREAIGWLLRLQESAGRLIRDLLPGGEA